MESTAVGQGFLRKAPRPPEFSHPMTKSDAERLLHIANYSRCAPDVP